MMFGYRPAKPALRPVALLCLGEGHRFWRRCAGLPTPRLVWWQGNRRRWAHHVRQPAQA